ncbi:hypothetical protein E3J84_03220 [Candidatus Aerophobetes bacterium]|uniref:ABC-2 type transporter transmembrane domain-containing protein n=1 Tax=Aerophobetes bacterium TaxID=2030807 RepID=A0A523RZF6_UNCAE|nr:MAG: hypothetical protein E3J84_03220 [Candidatus Aerophobetes bacterium]
MRKRQALMRKRIINVIKKEWRITFSSMNSVLFVILLPVILTLQTLLCIYLAMRFAGAQALIKTILGKGMENWLAAFPALQELPLIERFQVFFFSQFPFYLLLIPALIAMSLATFSIIEEKQTRTLEPLLVTPVRTWELLLGKSLAGAILALFMSWFCAGIFLIATMWMGSANLLESVWNAQWLISLFLLVPLVSLLSFLLGLIASSKAHDAKSAQNIALVIVLPVLAIIGVQLTGFLVFTPARLLILSIVVGMVSLLVLRVAVRLFQRESIVVAWR